MTGINAEMMKIIDGARRAGWVLEPDAKRLFSTAGIEVPRYAMASSAGEAQALAREIGYPVVAKVVSPAIMHKSDVGGVAVGINGDGELADAFGRFKSMDGFQGMHIEEMLSGVELILGARIDDQFGPMILLGMGGTGVEIYRDVALRMAPLSDADVKKMLSELKARRLLEGYRGAEPVDMGRLVFTVKAFSSLVMDLQDKIESVDANPLLCSSKRCVAADARIIVRREKEVMG
jgi:succinyl-CoA synthetase beta subunit